MTTEQQTLPAERSRAMVSDDLVWIMDTARFEHMWRIAQAMANAKLMPEHLRNSPSDCMLVVEQSNRWGMSPFAVASCTFSVGGKLGYEGKLVAGVINARGNLKHRLSYEYEGDPDKKETLACTVSGTIQGEDEPRTVRVTWRQGDGMSKGAKDKWASQPEQQLAYFGARAWARRHMPELLLGIYTPEELIDAEGDMRDVTPNKRPTAAERRARMAEVESVEVVDADGEIHYLLPGEVLQFLRDHPGAIETAEQAVGGAADQRLDEAQTGSVSRPAVPQQPRRGRPPKQMGEVETSGPEPSPGVGEWIVAMQMAVRALPIEALAAHRARYLRDIDDMPEDVRQPMAQAVVDAFDTRRNTAGAPTASDGNGSSKLLIWLGPLAQIEGPAKEALGELKAAFLAVESVGELNALIEHNGDLLRALKGGNAERMTAAIDEARKRLDEPPDDSWQLGDEPPAEGDEGQGDLGLAR